MTNIAEYKSLLNYFHLKTYKMFFEKLREDESIK
jgi:hypothetical protein